MSMIILVLSDREADLRFAREVSSRVDASLVQYSWKEGRKEAFAKTRELLRGSTELVLFLDVGQIGDLEEFQWLFGPAIGKGPGRIHPDHVHILINEPQSGARGLAGNASFGHLVIRKGDWDSPGSVQVPEAARAHARVVSRVSRRDRRHLEFVGREAPIQSRSLSFQDSREKSNVLDIAKDFLVKAIGMQDRMAASIVNSVDELLLNAFYDAVEECTGSTISRSTPVRLEAGRAVELHMTYDGENVEFTVVDHYGSLDREKTLSQLLKAYDAPGIQVSSTTHRAGVGLASTSKCGGSLFISTERGVRTEVSVLFKQAASYREFKNQSRSISISTN